MNKLASVNLAFFALILCLFSVSAAQTAVSGRDNLPFDAKAFAHTFTHRFATVNGVRIHYVMGGQGEPVVLLHGYPETWYDWRKVMPILAVGGEHGLGDFGAKNLDNVAANVTGLIIKDCGHFVNEEQPEELSKAILTFFAQE